MGRLGDDARPDFVMTASGVRFTPLVPRDGDICIEDIAHALAQINRFGGHARVPYSVAQHSVHVSQICEALLHGVRSPALPLAGLLHDASEAYLADVCTPVKSTPAFGPYRSVEAVLQAAIYVHFGLSAHTPDAVHVVDRRMCRTEQRDLMPPPYQTDIRPYQLTIDPWPWQYAQEMFLIRFKELQ